MAVERAKGNLVCPRCGSRHIFAVRRSAVERARRARAGGEPKPDRREKEPDNLHGCLLAFVVFFTFGLALLIPIVIAFVVNLYHRLRTMLLGDKADPVVLFICQDCRHRWRAPGAVTSPPKDSEQPSASSGGSPE